MGKKSSQSSPMKISNHEGKPQLNNLMKILKPKVYITGTCNFKRLVQHPSLPTSLPLSPPSWEVPFDDEINYPDFYQHNLAYEENPIDVTFGSSWSQEYISLTAASSNCVMGESEKMEFYEGLEWMLMEMDSGSSDYKEMFVKQDQICVYDYDLYEPME